MVNNEIVQIDNHIKDIDAEKKVYNLNIKI